MKQTLSLHTAWRMAQAGQLHPLVAQELCRKVLALFFDHGLTLTPELALKTIVEIVLPGLPEPAVPSPPAGEWDLLAHAAGDAQALAEEGRASDGLNRLKRGMEAVQAAQESGEPWAPTMLDAWQQAIELFHLHYGRS
jgi:hypothetical protein